MPCAELRRHACSCLRRRRLHDGTDLECAEDQCEPDPEQRVGAAQDQHIDQVLQKLAQRKSDSQKEKGEGGYKPRLALLLHQVYSDFMPTLPSLISMR